MLLQKHQGLRHCRNPSSICTPSLQPYARHHRRTVILCQAKGGKDSKGKAPGGPEDSKDAARKADFSAYWSLKVRQWFSARRDYLEGAESQRDKQPEVLKKLGEAIEDQSAAVRDMENTRHKKRMEQAASDMERARQADEAASKLLQPLEKVLVPGGIPQQSQQPPIEQALTDVQMARQYLHTTQVSGIALTLYRVRKVLQDLITLPFTAAHALWKGWHELFESQRYEQFLMSEGERIWYWRNRTENERWFWEIFAWDRLLFPILCTVAYEYVVPNHLIWAAVVPAMFITWQTGKLLGPQNMEFWLIAFFTWRKCSTDILAYARMLFVWA